MHVLVPREFHVHCMRNVLQLKLSIPLLELDYAVALRKRLKTFWNKEHFVTRRLRQMVERDRCITN